MKNIAKEEKNIIDDEGRHLRQLDRLDYMSQYLKEDFALTENSLNEAEKIKELSRQEMSEFESKSKQEITDIEL